jgi:hypothetical protein
MIGSLKSEIVGVIRTSSPVAFVAVKDGWAKLHPLHFTDLERDDAMFASSKFVAHDPLTKGWCITKWENEDAFDVVPPSAPEAAALQSKADLWHASASPDARLAIESLLPPKEPISVKCSNGHECLPFTYTKRHNCDLRRDAKLSATCKKSFDVGDAGFRCHSCDYDVCMACYGAVTGSASPPAEVETISDFLKLLVTMVSALKEQSSAAAASSASSSAAAPPKARLDTHSLFCSVASAIASGSPRPKDAAAAACALITAVVPGSSILSRQALRQLDAAMHPDVLPSLGTCHVTVPNWVIKAALPQQSAVMPLMFAGSPLICMPSFGWADVSTSPASSSLRISIPAACVVAHMRAASASAPASSPLPPSSIESLADSTGLPQNLVLTAVEELKSVGMLKVASAADARVVLCSAWSDAGFSDCGELSPLNSGRSHDSLLNSPTFMNLPSRSESESSAASTSTAMGFFSSTPYNPPSHPALTSSSTIIRSHVLMPQSFTFIFLTFSTVPHTLLCVIGSRRSSRQLL